MNACQVCGKKIEQPARGLRRNCSDTCRALNAARNRERFNPGSSLITARLSATQTRKLRNRVAGQGHGAVTRFVREAIEKALRGGS